MRHADPDPPVVVVTGDLLSHHISKSDATPTAVSIAHLLNAAFPRAQFVLTLGNVDSACGDYALAPDAPFLRSLARAWGPLVNRNGAAPDFQRTFAHDGFYTAALPVPGAAGDRRRRRVLVAALSRAVRLRRKCGERRDERTRVGARARAGACLGRVSHSAGRRRVFDGASHAPSGDRSVSHARDARPLHRRARPRARPRRACGRRTHAQIRLPHRRRDRSASRADAAGARDLADFPGRSGVSHGPASSRTARCATSKHMPFSAERGGQSGACPRSASIRLPANTSLR